MQQWASTCVSRRAEAEEIDTLPGVSPGPHDAHVPVGTFERNMQMSTTTAIVIVLVAIVVVAGFYVLVGYIVHETGSTNGIADIGRAVAAIIAAMIGRGS
jgi:hypothetical protein